jgi:Lrp/AsnC family leucine-responsive transcriptional regulator
MTNERLDDIDLEILRALQTDGRLTVRQLAAIVHRSPTPVFERVHRLERTGCIRRYAAVLNADRLGQGFMVFCQVKLRMINRDIATRFIELVGTLPEVTECYNVSGAFDYLLKIHAPSMRDYQEFILNKLGAFDLIGSIESTFVMSEVKNDPRLPI